VVTPCLTIYKNVIKEYQDESSKVQLKKMIHETLEGRWHICNSKWNDQKFIVAIMGAKSSLENIGLFDTNLVVSGS